MYHWLKRERQCLIKKIPVRFLNGSSRYSKVVPEQRQNPCAVSRSSETRETLILWRSSAPSWIRWFEARSEQVLDDIEQAFAEFRLSEALMATYKHIWDDFCSWYLELAKPTYGEPSLLARFLLWIG